MLFQKTSRNTDSCDLFCFDLSHHSPEFIGRIPRIVPLHPLSEDDLVRIIQEPEDSLLSQVSSDLSIPDFSINVFSV